MGPSFLSFRLNFRNTKTNNSNTKGTNIARTTIKVMSCLRAASRAEKKEKIASFS